MKGSRYNYFVPYKDKVILLNGVTEKHVLLPKERADIYRTILENPSEYTEQFGSFLQRMREGGFVVDAERDELDDVKRKCETLRRNDQYYLMILPTYQCNVRCWYCGQHHQDLFLTDQMVTNIKAFIKQKLKSEEIKHFHISWFGGEPLLSFDKLLDLTEFSRDLAKSLGKLFTAQITTNGTLLNEERISKLREAGVVHYQITIDGDPQTHDSVKVLTNASAFERTMKNVNLAAKYAKVILRFNYTQKNLKPVEIMNGINSYLSDESKKNVTFHLVKVWQEDRNTIINETAEKLMELAQRSGLKVNTLHHGLCYADQKYYDCIFPNGKIGKCDHVSVENAPGVIEENGEIKWSEDMSAIYNYNIFNNADTECFSCNYLPICWGPCMAKKESHIREHGSILCTYGDKKNEEMAVHIKNIVETQN